MLEFYCTEVHSFLHGSRLCSIQNSHQYISVLLKTAIYYSQEQDKSISTLSSNESKKKENTSPVVSRRQSKIRPVALPLDVKLHTKPVQRVNPAIVLSPGNHMRLFFPAAVDTFDVGGDSDQSGYDGDIEFCDVWLDNIDEEDKSAGSGGLHTPLPLVRVPQEIKRKLCIESPIWQCLELLKECIDDDNTISKWY